MLEKVVHLQIEHSLVIQEDPGGQACYPELEQKHSRSYINLVRTKSERLKENQNEIDKQNDNLQLEQVRG